MNRRFLSAFLGLAILASVTFVSASQESASAQAEVDTTMLLFDLSGSMGQREPDGRTRLEVAQQAMIEAIGGIAPGSRNMGIRSFSDCGVTTLEQAPAPVDQTLLASTINSFTADGSTDIAVALRAAAGDFANSSGRNTVILLSDGAHNCAGDPCQTASDLIDAGIDIVVNAIGIGTAGTAAETELSCIANVTGGTVVSVDGADELFDAIDQAFDGEGATAGIVEYGIATCINSALVQNNPSLLTASLGDTYRDSGGTSRVLVTGQQCNFDCNGGFDINCDGVIGDFCDSAFDLDTVHGVGQCLAQLGLDDGDGEPISEIEMLEIHCVGSNSGGLGLVDPAEIAEACGDYRDATTFQRRADNARGDGDASHAAYNQVLADDAFAKALTQVNVFCAAEPSDAPIQSTSGFDWRMNHRISGDDGLVLSNVFLGNRRMADRISIPYLSVDTGGSVVRIELMASPLLGDCPDATSRSRLVRSSVSPRGSAPQIEAVYRIDKIDGLDGVLTVTQRYEFDPELPGGQCEPSQVGPAPGAFIDFRILPCSPFRLSVDYDYAGPDAFTSIEIPQRLHFRVESQSNNAATALLDRDSLLAAFLTFGNPIAGTLPFTFETIAPALLNGEQAPDAPFDNYHQTFRDEVSKPTGLPAAPGCPECVHIHWRWSNLISAQGYFGPGGPGSPLIPAGSTQSLNIGVSRFQSDELDPVSYADVINGEPVGIAGGDPVMWYISSSSAASDTFFDHQGVGGAFFSHSYINLKVDAEIPSQIIGDGETTPVAVTLRNDGPGDADNVVVDIEAVDGQVLEDTLPANCELTDGVGQVFCTYDEIRANTSVPTIEFEARRPTSTPGSTTILIEAEADQVEFDSGDATDQVLFTSAPFADLELTGSVTENGDERTYQVILENNQIGEAWRVVLVLELPDGVDPTSVEVGTLVSSDCVLSTSQATVTCEWPSLTFLGDNRVVNISVPSGSQPGEPLVATATSDSPDFDETNNQLEIDPG